MAVPFGRQDIGDVDSHRDKVLELFEAFHRGPLGVEEGRPWFGREVVKSDRHGGAHGDRRGEDQHEVLHGLGVSDCFSGAGSGRRLDSSSVVF
jgi:hypothetical protein